MNRRNLLFMGAAAAAGLAGVGAAWFRHEPQKLTAAQTNTAQDALWAMSFDTPDGKPQPMDSFRGKPLLLNFWATWCPPCVEELPLLDAFYQEQKAKGWQVLGLAVDQPSAVRKWLQARPLSFAVGMAGLSGTELSKSLGNLSGSLPFTAVFGGSGALLHRKTGKVSSEDLAQWGQLK
ncbi:MAG: TlpA disulfide reductase family protein [Polaromonas sp.]|jgi:thiol-disulfide isomerase/thioredoxin